MKKILTFAAVAVLGLAAFSGCKKSSSSGSGSSLTATVNGKTFTSNHCIFANSGGELVITGFNGSGGTGSFPYLTIGLFNFSAGTTNYSIDDTSTTNLNVAGIDSSASTVAVAQTGTVTIKSSSSSSVSGTFSFTCSDGTTVTNGSFTASTH